MRLLLIVAVNALLLYVLGAVIGDCSLGSPDCVVHAWHGVG